MPTNLQLSKLHQAHWILLCCTLLRLYFPENVNAENTSDAKHFENLYRHTAHDIFCIINGLSNYCLIHIKNDLRESGKIYLISIEVIFWEEKKNIVRKKKALDK